MNKIEQYKQDQVLSYMQDNDDDAFETGWEDGFNNLLKLELPIKFTEWLRQEDYYADEKGWYKNAFTDEATVHSTQELFNHWLENVWNYE